MYVGACVWSAVLIYGNVLARVHNVTLITDMSVPEYPSSQPDRAHTLKLSFRGISLDTNQL